MNLDLHGRVAIVTGGSQGIGRSIALALGRQGAEVVVCARRADRLEAVAEELRAIGAGASAVSADVTATGTPERLVGEALERFGSLDIVVNNAGKGHAKPFLRLDDDDWRDAIELNLMSAVRLTSAAVPYMREKRWGRIVNIASRVAREPDPYFAPYAAAKAALINFSKSTANGFSSDGVLTNCVVPGLIAGEGVDEAATASAVATNRTAEEVMAEMLRRRPIPAGRIGHPEDVAGLVTFLCSEAAGWITGGCFMVDGGTLRSMA